MITKVQAAGAASVPGLPVTRAMAIADDGETASVDGGGAARAFGDSGSRGGRSPRFGPVQGSRTSRVPVRR
ncbi:hypothetical protein [Streptomyces fulvorobeus]|uniref:Uncharacterized protein n=1 Tax=Streptomyces fulvorobeus TaxID=284028 RepID=A0A7Y9HG65_9ACTN|nr:hypothetical protein [Streptomyces fulvorobeus]NYE43636.1 hypothetical protein [Streptomyces fulvorobeus]